MRHRHTRHVVGRAVAVAAALGMVAGLASPAQADDPRLIDQAAPTSDASGDATAHYRQYTGERILGLAEEPTCTVVMTKNYPMANTAYGPDLPFQGPFKPGDCTGSYTRIVAHVHTNVTGIQFDRIGWINLGGARIVTLSSQEPRGDGAGEVVQDETYDVTRYASLFTKGSPVEFNIANVVTGQYDGIFYSDLSFEFYDQRSVPLPDANPDIVTGLPASTILADPVSQSFTVPANTTELSDELYVKASGGCDEFWWAAAPAPYQGQCDGYPIREIDVAIDDQPAALVNTYPALFTGANGPSWWHPIPAPRTYDLRPYTVDLGPFIGTLTDGKSHTVTYTIPERRWTDGNDVTVWSNLLIMTNKDSKGRTTGALGKITDDGVTIHDGGSGSVYHMHWTHQLAVQGSTQAAGEPKVTRATTFLSDARTDAAATNENRYRWRRSSILNGDTGRTDNARYYLLYRADGWSLKDYGRTTFTGDGQPRSSRLRDRMQSFTAAGTPSNRRSHELWSLAYDGPLGCGTTHLVGENPNLVRKTMTDECHFD